MRPGLAHPRSGSKGMAKWEGLDSGLDSRLHRMSGQGLAEGKVRGCRGAGWGVACGSRGGPLHLPPLRRLRGRWEGALPLDRGQSRATEGPRASAQLTPDPCSPFPLNLS